MSDDTEKLKKKVKIMQKIIDNEKLSDKEKKYIDKEIKKKCVNCDKKKILSDFCANKTCKMGRDPMCKECKKAKMKEHRSKQKAKLTKNKNQNNSSDEE